MITSLTLQIELEKLNNATDEINRLEMELDVRSVYWSLRIVIISCLTSVLLSAFLGSELDVQNVDE